MKNNRFFNRVSLGSTRLVRVTLNNKADKPVALISGSNWNLECWFLWREENRRTRRKTLGAGTRTNNKLNPRDVGSGNRTQATAVGSVRSHHCTIPRNMKSRLTINFLNPSTSFPGPFPYLECKIGKRTWE